ncbi:MAG: glycoside hydrolase family 99-like domain-containing protein, partial [Candidatus Omnitrophica bacterium]|nr:glycoside hydrolase family 99-like domain-containing protein [Candidatus Omnitrophota bacterium]
TWRERDRECGGLIYYPVVDTGWDARPWHGKKAQVIRNRTADGFERLLAQAKSYCEEHGKPFVVLGPVNEWGEGSYIEPCVEFEFDMLERIRKVFGIPEPSGWPVNIGPSDIGLGPYDLTK